MKEEIKEAADKMVEKWYPYVHKGDSTILPSEIAKKCAILECQSLIDELNNALYVENESNPTTEYLGRRLSHYQDIKNYLQTL